MYYLHPDCVERGHGFDSAVVADVLTTFNAPNWDLNGFLSKGSTKCPSNMPLCPQGLNFMASFDELNVTKSKLQNEDGNRKCKQCYVKMIRVRGWKL